MKRTLVGAVLACASLLGCADQAAFGRTEDMRKAWPAFEGRSHANIEVLVQDRRPYVVSHEKSSNFVGLSRGGFGNPFDVVTTSGAPLASDVQNAIVQGFNNAGVNAKEAPASAVNHLAAESGARLLVVSLNEWKSDTYTTTSFIYDLGAAVYDVDGKELASARIHGNENISSGVDGGRRTLSELLQTKEISGALIQ